MQTVIDVLISLFSILISTQLFGMPLIVWLLIPLLLGLIINFLKGKKD